MRSFLALVLLGVSAWTSAADCNDRNDEDTCDVSQITDFNACGNYDSYGELKCAYSLRVQHEAALAKAYENTKNALKVDGARLEKTQALWVQFRDAECGYRTASFGEDMFKLRAQRFDLCVAELSAAREKQILQSQADCPSCPH